MFRRPHPSLVGGSRGDDGEESGGTDEVCALGGLQGLVLSRRQDSASRWAVGVGVRAGGPSALPQQRYGSSSSRRLAVPSSAPPTSRQSAAAPSAPSFGGVPRRQRGGASTSTVPAPPSSEPPPRRHGGASTRRRSVSPRPRRSRATAPGPSSASAASSPRRKAPVSATPPARPRNKFGPGSGAGVGAGAGASSSSGTRRKRALPRTVVAINYHKRRNHLGELFKTVTSMLLDKSSGAGTWRLQEKPVFPFDLCLGESISRGIPYRALALNPGTASRPPLVNFYHHFKALTWKVEMVETLRQYCKANRIDVNTLIPESFVFRAKRNSKRERQRFLDSYTAAAGRPDVANVWIVKPSGGGKGKDIEVEADMSMLVSRLDGVRYGSTDWVFSKYIERPLLLRGGRKFDIRTWVLLDHQYHVHLYRQGVLRTGSVAYSLDDLSDRFVHLSNHCIQEDHPAYGAYEPTNEMWWHEFGQYLRTAFPDADIDFERDILPQIHQQILISFEACKPALWDGDGGGNGQYGHRSFNLFGFDFMIDDQFKVWLIEINSSPGVAKQLLHPLARSLIRTAIEPVCPPLKKQPPRAGAGAGSGPSSLAGSGRSRSWHVPASSASASASASGSASASVVSPPPPSVRARAPSPLVWSPGSASPESASRSKSSGSHITHPATNPDGHPCCGRRCCQWGFERIDDHMVELVGAAVEGRGVGVRGTVGVGVGLGVNNDTAGSKKTKTRSPTKPGPSPPGRSGRSSPARRVISLPAGAVPLAPPSTTSSPPPPPPRTVRQPTSTHAYWSMRAKDREDGGGGGGYSFVMG